MISPVKVASANTELREIVSRRGITKLISVIPRQKRGMYNILKSINAIVPTRFHVDHEIVSPSQVVIIAVKSGTGADRRFAKLNRYFENKGKQVPYMEFS